MIKRIVPVLALMTLAALGCGKSETPAGQPAGEAGLTGAVKVDGSSTVFPITEAVAEEFQKTARDVRVTVGISGTGGGFKKFCAGEIDIADASRTIKKSELDLCAQNGVEFVELPVAYDGLAIMVNPANSWVETITVDELKKMWAPEAQGKVMKWSDVRPGWPAKELHLFGPGVDSGTYDYFTEAIVGESHSSRGDYTSSEDDNVIVQGIATDELALGFFGFAYYEENKDKLKLLRVDAGKGPIAPSIETVKDGTYAPLSRPIFIYVATKSLDRPEVAAFVKFYLENAPALVKEVGYIPLPDAAYTLAGDRVAKRTTGTMFGEGSHIGMTVEQMMQQETAGSAGAPAATATATAGQ
ncbi:MAG: PstS family phosphate ABC transporter substrate-binding protein [Thermoanaerobaculia bacterium]